MAAVMRGSGLCLLVCLLIGCGRGPVSLDSEEPAALLYTIHRAGESGDRAAAPGLVELLQHDDPAVRMWAINALERIEGQRLGYEWDAPPAQRAPAVDRWVRRVAQTDR